MQNSPIVPLLPSHQIIVLETSFDFQFPDFTLKTWCSIRTSFACSLQSKVQKTQPPVCDVNNHMPTSIENFILQNFICWKTYTTSNPSSQLSFPRSTLCVKVAECSVTFAPFKLDSRVATRSQSRQFSDIVYHGVGRFSQLSRHYVPTLLSI